MIDTHTHLQFDAYQSDLDAVLARMQAAEVSRAIVVGVDVATSRLAVELSNKHANLFAAVGIHPGDTQDLNLDQAVSDLEDCIDSKTVAIGEIGLDDKEFDNVAPNKSGQAAVFERMIELANQKKLPAILHSRMAEIDVINFVRNHTIHSGGVVHCYTADYATAKKVLDAGLLISFTAMITYPKNEELRRVVAKLPHDRVMIETDCPFLPPQAFRGQRNEPAHARSVAEAIAVLWGKDLEYVDHITSTTAQKFFALPNT